MGKHHDEKENAPPKDVIALHDLRRDAEHDAKHLLERKPTMSHWLKAFIRANIFAPIGLAAGAIGGFAATHREAVKDFLGGKGLQDIFRDRGLTGKSLIPAVVAGVVVAAGATWLTIRKSLNFDKHQAIGKNAPEVIEKQVAAVRALDAAVQERDAEIQQLKTGAVSPQIPAALDDRLTMIERDQARLEKTVALAEEREMGHHPESFPAIDLSNNPYSAATDGTTLKQEREAARAERNVAREKNNQLRTLINSGQRNPQEFAERPQAAAGAAR